MKLNLDELDDVTGGARLGSLGLPTGSASELDAYREPANDGLAGIGSVLGPIFGGLTQLANQLFRPQGLLGGLFNF